MNETQRKLTQRGLSALVIVVAAAMVALVLGILGALAEPADAADAPALQPSGQAQEITPTVGLPPLRAGRMRLSGLQPMASEVTVDKTARTGTGDDSFVYNGDRITYTLTIASHNADTAASDVFVVDELPKDTWGQVQLDQILCGEGCEQVVETRYITTPLGTTVEVTVVTELMWQIRELAAGEILTKSFSGRVMGQPDGQVLRNTAVLDYAGGFDASEEVATTVRVRAASNGQASLSDAPTWLSSDLGGTLSLDWGDFDRDGYLDLAVGSTIGSAVYRNVQGQLALFWTEPNERYTLGVRWADVDGNGWLELIAVGESVDNNAVLTGTNYIYGLNSGGTAFQQVSAFTSDYQLLRVEPGDYIPDPNGSLDLLVSTNAIDAPCPVQLLENSGGSMQFAQCVSTDATANVAAGDFDNDDDLDVVLGLFPNKTVLVLNNGGILTTTNPSVSTVAVELGTTFLPYDFGWGDFDRDGYLDLAAAFPLDRRVRVYRNLQGTGFQFVSQSEFRTRLFYTPLAVEWGDFNGDGRLDLAVADVPPKIYFNTGDPGTPFADLPSRLFSLPQKAVNGQIWSLAAADSDNDGDLDLSFGNRDGASLLFTNFAPFLRDVPDTVNMWPASSVAWGDVDGDGDLDLLYGAGPSAQVAGAGYAKLYRNQNGAFSLMGQLQGARSRFGPHSLAFGDVNDDGYLDIALGTRAQNLAYVSANAPLDPNPNPSSWNPSLSLPSRSVAWGDSDIDGDLDLFIGNEGPNALYLNLGNRLADAPAWTSSEEDNTRSVAWGDYDGDGYLDIAVGNYGQPNRVYHNEGANTFRLAWSSASLVSNTTSVAWADYDGDGDLDLAVGNYGQANLIHENVNGSLEETPTWASQELAKTTSLAWGDWDNDGDLDLAVGNDGEPDQVYTNQGSKPGLAQMVWVWTSADSYQTSGVAWGDRDGDGDLDLAVSQSSTGRNGVYENTYVIPSHLTSVFTPTEPLPNNPSYLSIDRPGATRAADHYYTPERLTRTVSISYMLFDPDGTRQVAVPEPPGDEIVDTHYEYSLDGGGTWQEATPLTGAPPYPAATSRLGEQATFVWNAGADEAISDDARFRITVVHSNPAGPVQRASTSAISPPFRVRATTCVWPENPTIEMSPANPDPGQAVRFEGSIETGSGVLTFTWDFGDGTTGVGQVVQHTYTQTSVYNVRLAVSSTPCPASQTVYAVESITIGSGVLNYAYLPLVRRSATGSSAAGELDMARAPLAIAPLALEGAGAESPERPAWFAARAAPDTQAASRQDPVVARVAPAQIADKPATFDPAVIDVTSCLTACSIISPVQNARGIHVQPTINAAGDQIAFWSTGNLGGIRPWFNYGPPLVLLVDDDDNWPDVRPYYQGALDALGVAYDTWNTGNSDNEPDAAALGSYLAAIWFSGDEWGGYAGPGPAGEDALSRFLDNAIPDSSTGSSRCLMVSSQDYHYDRGLTPFMRNYLGVSSVTNDVYLVNMTGAGAPYAGLGPYNLAFPIYNYSDWVYPDGTAGIGFMADSAYAWFLGGPAPAAVTKVGSTYKTTFWGVPWEAIPDAANRQQAMARFIDWCGLGSMPTVVINEIQLQEPSAIELLNYGPLPVNMSGWQFSGGLGGTSGTYSFGAFTLFPGAYVVLHEGSGSNSATDLYMNTPLPWANGDKGYASLKDPSGRGIDFVRWKDAWAVPPAGTIWIAPNPPSPAADNLGRGDDTNHGSDWCQQEPTLGAKNPGCDSGFNNPDANIEIFTYNVVGNSFTQATVSNGSILGGFNLWPSLDAAGTRLAFFSDRDLVGSNEDENFEIVMYDSAAGSFTQVTDSSGCVNLSPAISGDGSRIVFASDCDLHNNPALNRNNGDGNQEIFVAEIGPSGAVTLTQVTDTADVVNDQPAISGDGTRIAFVYDANGSSDVQVYDVTALPPAEVATFAQGINVQPALDEDGTHLAFASDRDGNQEIYWYNTATTSFTQVTSTALGTTNEQPSISGDGLRIAYVSDSGIWLYDGFKHVRTRFSPVGDSNSRPSISANGMHIAFAADRKVYRASFPLADLEIAKAGTSRTFVPGSMVSYVITVTNHGPGDVLGAVVSDVVPAEILTPTWRCTPTAGSLCTPAGAGDVLDAISLTVGGRAVYVLSGELDAAATADVINVATVTAPPWVTEHDTSNNVASERKVLTPEAGLGVAKAGAADTVLAGTTFTYTLTYSNAQPSDAQVVFITDTLPQGTSFGGMVGPAPHFAGPAVSGRKVTWYTPTLPARTTGTIVFTVTVGADVPAFSVITNSATITSNVPDPDNSDNAYAITTTVTTQADLQVTKSDYPDPVNSGGTLTYTLVYTNHGPSYAREVAITETWPLSVTWGGVASSAMPSLAVNPAGRWARWYTPTLAAGRSGRIVFTVTVGSGFSAPGAITNAVEIGSGTPDPGPAPNQDAITTAVRLVVDVGVDKRGPAGSAAPGETITYTVAVTNGGQVDVPGVTLSDTLPLGDFSANSVSWTCAAGPGSLCGTAAGTGAIDGVISRLGARSAVTYTVVGTLVPSLTVPSVANTAGAAVPAGFIDPLPGNNQSTVTVTLVPEADLVVSKSEPAGTVVAGETLTYSLTYTNTGPSYARAVTLTDRLAAGTVYGGMLSGAAPAGVAPSRQALTWTVSSLAPDQPYTLVFTAQVGSAVAPGTITNQAAIRSAVDDPDGGDDTSAVTTTVTAVADLEVTKRYEPEPVVAGGTLTYTLVYTNHGPSYAREVGITDSLHISATWGGEVSGALPARVVDPAGRWVSWYTPTLGAGASGAIVFTVTVTDALSAPGTITNSVRMTSSALDPGPALNEGTVTTTVILEADLGASKRSEPQPFVAGTPVTYTIVVTNGSGVRVPGATVSDAFPDVFKRNTLSWSCTALPPSSCGAVSSGLDTDIDATVDLAAGGTITYTVTGTLSPSLKGGADRVTNTASVAMPAGYVDPLPGNNQATVTDTLAARADLEVTKAGLADPVVAGETLTYSLAYTNTGPSAAEWVTLTDQLPGGTTYGGIVSGAPPSPPAGQAPAWYISALAAGETGTIVFTVTVEPWATTPLTNGVTIGSAVADPDGSDDTSGVTTTVTAVADLEVLKRYEPEPAVAGETLTYTLVYTNHGPSYAREVGITDSLHVSATWGGEVSGVLPNRTVDPAGRWVSWYTPTLSAGASGAIVFTVTVTDALSAPGTITNSVRIASSAVDPGAWANEDVVTPSVVLPVDLGVRKDSAVDAVAPGEPITYSIVVSNTAQAAVPGVAVSDVLPPSTFTAGTVSWTCRGTGGSSCGSGTGDINATVDLAASSTVTYVVTGTLVPSLTMPTVTNRVTVTVPAGFIDPLPGNNQSAVTDTLVPRADLEVIKAGLADPVTAGGTLTYSLTYTNVGPSAAQWVTLTDQLPGGTTYGGIVSGMSPSLSAAQALTWYTPLAAGETGAIVFTVTSPLVTVTTTLTNTASITSSILDPITANNVYSASTVVNP